MAARIDVRTGLEELDRDECLTLLGRAPMGRLAVVIDGHPLVFPVNFTLDGQVIVLRTAPGTKLHAARNGPVAFEVDGIDSAYHRGWSVLALGDVEEVTHPSDIAALERLPLTPWCGGAKPIWLRIRPRALTGRRIPPHGRVATKEEQRCR